MFALQRNIDEIVFAKVGKSDDAALVSEFNLVENTLSEVDLRLTELGKRQVEKIDVAFEQSTAQLNQAERNQSWMERLVADCRAWCNSNKVRLETLRGDLDMEIASLEEFPDKDKLDVDLCELFGLMEEIRATFKRFVEIKSPQNDVAVKEFRDAA